MTTTSRSSIRHLATMVAAIASSAVSLLALQSAIAGGQAAPAAKAVAIDHRWQAWAGCWEPEANSNQLSVAAPGTEGGLEICVVPVAGVSAVDIETVIGQKVAGTRHIDADGAHHPVVQDGCTGWESAEWSSTNARVYLHSDVTCQGTPERVTNGLMAMTSLGEWIDVQGIATGPQTGVGVGRYVMIPDSGPALARSSAAFTEARWAAARSAPERWVNTGDITEASRHVDTPVIEAWLMQLTNQLFTVDGDRLIQMAHAHVAPEVIDLVVALAYPDRFTVDPATNHTAARTTPLMNSDSAANRRYAASPYDYGFGFDDPYYYGYGYSPFGYSPYGYGYGGGYGLFYNGGYGSGGVPIVVVKVGSNTPGRVVNGKGYTQTGSGNGNNGTAQPSTAQTPTRAPAPSSGGSSSGGGASAPAPRTAIPRPPGGTP